MMPLQVPTVECPFADMPEKRRTWYSLNPREMQKWQWLKPLLVPQIEFQEWTPDRYLRHPKVAGLRCDKDRQSVLRKSRVKSATPLLFNLPLPLSIEVLGQSFQGRRSEHRLPQTRVCRLISFSDSCAGQICRDWQSPLTSPDSRNSSRILRHNRCSGGAPVLA